MSDEAAILKCQVNDAWAREAELGLEIDALKVKVDSLTLYAKAAHALLELGARRTHVKEAGRRVLYSRICEALTALPKGVLE